MLSDSFLQQVKERTPLVPFIERHMRLTRKGRSFLGLCPFHSEKTPSFTISEGSQHFHCFGCGAHGDVVHFAQKMHNFTFLEAVKHLAKEAGLLFEKEDVNGKTHHALYAVLEWACQWYCTALQRPKGETARDYLEKRGISLPEIKKFRLGFAPTDGFIEEARRCRMSLSHLEEAGLLIPSDRGLYPRFRDRLMFPIMDEKSRVIAFGGRLLGAGTPKYINSPEHPLFSKRRILYGSPHTLTKKDQWMVVEGYLDVIALQRYSPCVAPLGTAIDIGQLQTIWRFSSHPMICFDGDHAGRKAALALALKALGGLSPGLDLSFALLPLGEDPHSLIQKLGWQGFSLYQERALSLSEFLWFYLSRAYDLKQPTQHCTAQALWKQWVQTISDVSVRSAYQSFFREKMFRPKMVSSKALVTPVGLHQKILLGILVLYPHILLEVHEVLAHLEMEGEDWIMLKHGLLDFYNETLPDTDIMSFLTEKTQIFWEQRLSDIVVHLPKSVRDNPGELKEYWIALSSASQGSLCQRQEWKEQHDKIFNKKSLTAPEDWRELQLLRQRYFYQ